MKQIAQWDKQNKAKTKTKEPGVTGKKVSKSDEIVADTAEEGPTYRDRAEERRTDANPDYDAESLQAVSRLDAEKTKFLGGDVDHTHLVK
eukprot:gene55791-74503_t